jgi:hypothetical protein
MRVNPNAGKPECGQAVAAATGQAARAPQTPVAG